MNIHAAQEVLQPELGDRVNEHMDVVAASKSVVEIGDVADSRNS